MDSHHHGVSLLVSVGYWLQSSMAEVNDLQNSNEAASCLIIIISSCLAIQLSILFASRRHIYAFVPSLVTYASHEV